MKIKQQKVPKIVSCKFEDYEDCLVAAQIENKIDHLKK